MDEIINLMEEADAKVCDFFDVAKNCTIGFSFHEDLRAAIQRAKEFRNEIKEGKR